MKQQKRLSDNTILKIQKMANLIEVVKGKRCTFESAIDFMYDCTLKSEEDIKQLARDMEYSSAYGRYNEKYGSAY